MGGFTCTNRLAFLFPSVAVKVSIVKPSPKATWLGNVSVIINNTAKDAAKQIEETFCLPVCTLMTSCCVYLILKKKKKKKNERAQCAHREMLESTANDLIISISLYDK